MRSQRKRSWATTRWRYASAYARCSRRCPSKLPMGPRHSATIPSGSRPSPLEHLGVRQHPDLLFEEFPPGTVEAEDQLEAALRVCRHPVRLFPGRRLRVEEDVDMNELGVRISRQESLRLCR